MIRTPEGQPVGRAQVIARGFGELCPAPIGAVALGEGYGTTDAAGKFEFSVLSASPAVLRCLRLQVSTGVGDAAPRMTAELSVSLPLRYEPPAERAQVEIIFVPE